MNLEDPRDTEEPKPEDFGVTSQQYDLYTHNGKQDVGFWVAPFAFLVVFSCIYSTTFVVTKDFGDALLWGILGSILPPGGLLTCVSDPGCSEFS